MIIFSNGLGSDSLPVRPRIEDYPPNRCPGRSQTVSVLLSHSFVTRTALRSGLFFILESGSSHDALGEESQLTMVFDTATTKQLG